MKLPTVSYIHCWPVLFSCFAKKEQGLFPAILTEQAWSMTDLQQYHIATKI